MSPTAIDETVLIIGLRGGACVTSEAGAVEKKVLTK